MALPITITMMKKATSTRIFKCLIVCGALGALAALGDVAESPSGLTFDLGARNRTREEVSHDVPGNPGGGAEVNKRAARVDGTHLMRFDSQVWGKAAYGPWTLYGRVANSIRESFRTNGKRREDRPWTAPDEFVLDNLYLDARGLCDGAWDFRIGRQDLSEGGKSVFGLDRILYDGTPNDFSRTYYADMIRVTYHWDEVRVLDVFALYNSDENPFAYGRQRVLGRSMNALTGNDDYGADQWGGGLVWHDAFSGKDIPYKVYAIHKRDTAYRREGEKIPAKNVSTLGALVMPNITDSLALELEGAGQVGEREEWGMAGGWMGAAGFDFHPKIISDTYTYFKLTALYYSGDDDWEDGHNDTGWDPVWARYTGDSEIFSRGSHARIVYWSNMFFLKPMVGATFGPHHGVSAFSGPIWSVADDGAGGGGGDFKGILSRVRYNFPVLLKPENARGIKRFEVFGHVALETFHPGSYYESSKPAIYARWQLDFNF